MLVLSRVTGEVVVIELEDGRTIEVEILGIYSKQVRCGFKAPPTIRIHRKEVMDRINKERESE